MTGTVSVWDLDREPAETSSETFVWRSYAAGGNRTSVPQYVEENSDRLKAKYLAFIYELGVTRINGRTVADHLDRGDGFSYWWMGRLVEKSPFKSPRIYCCLRVLALEELLRAWQPTELVLVTPDSDLAQTIEQLCDSLAIAFRREDAREGARGRSLRRNFDALPAPIRGVIALARHLVQRWSLRACASPGWFGDERALAFCSYFIHLDSTAANGGHFQSRQWGSEALTELLHRFGLRANWLHHFLFSAAVPDVETGVRWVESFNAAPAAEGHHSFLDSYLTVGRIAAAFRDWLTLVVKGVRLRRVRDAFYAPGSSAWLWPLLRDDWRTSISGPVAMNNCIWVMLFDAALADMPRQSKGLYLYENQGWERAFLRAWRRHEHGEIIAVQHATVPYWHLYYFDDPRNLEQNVPCRMELPDRLAVNGPGAYRAFASGGHSADRLVEVEALRYLALSTVRGRTGPRESASTKVLILGDIIPGTMETFLRLVEGAVQQLPPRYTFTVKPHPAYRVPLDHFPKLRASETNGRLDQILADYDVVVSANSTSAAVDAYVGGLPVIIMLDGSTLNLSPLRGQSNVQFVSTSEQLTHALMTAADERTTAVPTDTLFFLDAQLPRWGRLLAPADCA